MSSINRKGRFALYLFVVLCVMCIVFSCSPVILDETLEADKVEEEDTKELSAEGAEDPSNPGGMLLSISGPTSDEIENMDADELNYYELIAVNKDAPTVVEQVKTWRYDSGSSPSLSIKVPLIKNNTYYILLLGGNDTDGEGGKAPTLMLSGIKTITVPGTTFTIDITMQAMVVGTEFIAIDGTVFEQGRLQKTVGLYEDSNYRVRVTLGSDQNGQTVIGNGISALLEAQNLVSQGITSGNLGLIYNHGLTLVPDSNKGYFKNLSNPASDPTDEEISGKAISSDPEGSPQVYQYTIDNTGTASSDAYSFHFNMEYKPFGFTETTAWADVYTAGLTAEEGPVWVIRNGLNDEVQTAGVSDGATTDFTWNTDTTNANAYIFGKGDNWNGAIPISVVKPVETTSGGEPLSLSPGLYEGILGKPDFNPLPIKVYGNTEDAYEAALTYLNNIAAANYGAYTILLGPDVKPDYPARITLGSGTLTTSGTRGMGEWVFPNIKNTKITVAGGKAQTMVTARSDYALGGGSMTFGSNYTIKDGWLLDLDEDAATIALTSAVSNPGYTYDDTSTKVFTINNGRRVYVTDGPDTNTTCSTDIRRLVIDVGATANVTLDNATIDLNGAATAVSPIDVGTSGATLNLSLEGDNFLTSPSSSSAGGAGIRVSGTTSYKAALTITGTGTLNVTGGYEGAGIGGNNGEDGGTITFSGGTVAAIGGAHGAGIGGGRNGNGGEINIMDGTVTAKGGKDGIYQYGAGIGGGDADTGLPDTYEGGGSGDITISGGMVVATGDRGAGIGFGSYGVAEGAGTIWIKGAAKVMAKVISADPYEGFGTAIGGGDHSALGRIQIEGDSIVYTYSDPGGPNDSTYRVPAIIGGGYENTSACDIIIGGHYDTDGTTVVSDGGNPTVLAVTVPNSGASSRRSGIGGGNDTYPGTITIAGGTVITNLTIGGHPIGAWFAGKSPYDSVRQIGGVAFTQAFRHAGVANGGLTLGGLRVFTGEGDLQVDISWHTPPAFPALEFWKKTGGNMVIPPGLTFNMPYGSVFANGFAIDTDSLERVNNLPDIQWPTMP